MEICENGFWGLGRLENAMWGSAMAVMDSDQTQKDSILDINDAKRRK